MAVNFCPSRFALIALATVLLSSIEPTSAEQRLPKNLHSAAQSALAWQAFWTARMNNWSEPVPREVRLLQGKRVFIDVWMAKPTSGDVDEIYFIEGSSSAKATFPLELEIQYAGGQLQSAGQGVRGDSGVLIATNVSLSIPENLCEMAKVFGESKSRDIETVKLGLAHFLELQSETNAQHFCVGPFTPISPEVIIYWVERRAFVETAFPTTGKPELFVQAIEFAKITEAEAEVRRNSPLSKDPLCADIIRASWLNTWTANCVHNGVLIEVLPAPKPK